MAFEFDCPQYYDFENGMDDSNPEAYFETIRVVSPNSKTVEFVHCDSNIKPQENFGTPDFPVNSEPYKNTRSSLKKSQDPLGLLKSISSIFRSKKEPPLKKPKVTRTVDRPPSRIPASAIKRNLTGSRSISAKTEQKPLQKMDTNITQHPSKRPLTRTVPEPFSFATDKRLKMEVADKTKYKPFDYASTLRKNKENEGNLKNVPTRAVPDRLLRKRRISEKKTLAEEVLSFEQGRLDNPKPAANTKGDKYLSVTLPITPCLRTANRIRKAPLHEIVAVAPKNKINAQSQKPNLTLPTIAQKSKQLSKTAPVTKKQTMEKHASLQPQTEVPDYGNQFRARPIPKRILQGVTGLGVRAQIKPTEAHSPAFVLKKRAEAWKQHEVKEKETDKATGPQRCNHFVTRSTFQVPSKDYNNVRLLGKKNDNMKKVLKAERKVKTVSVQDPVQKATGNHNLKFLLEVQEKARSKANEWQKKMEDEMKRQQNALLFKARPCTVTRMKPFLPVKSNKPPTRTAGFQFQSDLRLLQRKKGHLESENNADSQAKTSAGETVNEEPEHISASLRKTIKLERLSLPDVPDARTPY